MSVRSVFVFVILCCVNSRGQLPLDNMPSGLPDKVDFESVNSRAEMQLDNIPSGLPDRVDFESVNSRTEMQLDNMPSGLPDKVEIEGVESQDHWPLDNMPSELPDKVDFESVNSRDQMQLDNMPSGLPDKVEIEGVTSQAQWPLDNMPSGLPDKIEIEDHTDMFPQGPPPQGLSGEYRDFHHHLNPPPHIMPSFVVPPDYPEDLDDNPTGVPPYGSRPDYVSPLFLSSLSSVDRILEPIEDLQ